MALAPTETPKKNWEIDPEVAQQCAKDEYNLSDSNWAQAHWEVAALRNLSLLSPYSKFDVKMPDEVLEASETEDNYLRPMHPKAEGLEALSPESQRVKMLPLRKVDVTKDLRDVPVTQLCQQVSGVEKLSHATLRMKHLVGLSDLTTSKDAQLLELVCAVAEHNSKDREVVEMMIRNNVDHKITTKQLLKREAHLPLPVYPNRSFVDSDIVTYPELVPAVEVPPPSGPSVHDVGYETWAQRVIDVGCETEDREALREYQERLTDSGGKLQAVEERVECVTTHKSPYRVRALEDRKLLIECEKEPPEESSQ